MKETSSVPSSRSAAGLIYTVLRGGGLELPLALDTVAGRGHGPKARRGDRDAAGLTAAISAARQPGQRILDLVQLVLLPSFEPRQDDANRRRRGVFRPRARLMALEGAELAIGQGEGAKEIPASILETPAEPLR